MIGSLWRAACVAGLALAPSVASAQQWRAAVFGNSSGETPEAAAESVAAASGLERAGVTLGTQLAEADPLAMAIAISDLARAEKVVLFFSGPLQIGETGEILLGAGGDFPVFASQLSIDNIGQRLAEGKTREAVVVLEDCAGRDPGTPGALSQLSLLPAPPLDLLLVTSAGPAGTCGGADSAVADRVAALDSPLTSLSDFEHFLRGANQLRLQGRPPPAGGEEGRAISAR